MGQAFDGEGNVLGGSFGPTKREVFGDLDARFKDAERIEIRKARASDFNQATDRLQPATTQGVHGSSYGAIAGTPVGRDQCSTAAPDSPEQHALNTQRRLVIAREEHEKARTNALAGAALVSKTAHYMEEAAREHESAVRFYLQTIGLTEIR